MRLRRSNTSAGTFATTTIVDTESGTTTVLLSRRRIVTWDVFTWTILPRSRMSVCGTCLIETLISACDQVPGRRGNCGTGPFSIAAAAAPANASKTRTTSVLATLRML
jgi:hypothetical protein